MGLRISNTTSTGDFYQNTDPLKTNGALHQKTQSIAQALPSAPYQGNIKDNPSTAWASDQYERTLLKKCSTPVSQKGFGMNSTQANSYVLLERVRINDKAKLHKMTAQQVVANEATTSSWATAQGSKINGQTGLKALALQGRLIEAAKYPNKPDPTLTQDLKNFFSITKSLQTKLVAQ
jgi:hypothetical protein